MTKRELKPNLEMGFSIDRENKQVRENGTMATAKSVNTANTLPSSPPDIHAMVALQVPAMANERALAGSGGPLSGQNVEGSFGSNSRPHSGQRCSVRPFKRYWQCLHRIESLSHETCGLR